MCHIHNPAGFKDDNSEENLLMKIGLISIALTLCVSTFAGSASASVKSNGEAMICKGDVGNGYDTTKPQYKTFGATSHYLTMDCPWWTRNVQKHGRCTYSLNGSEGEAYAYKSGEFHLFNVGSLGGIAILKAEGFLYFKMSEAPTGISGNEGQRWFRGLCKIAK